jgi:hypothetical protein
MNDPKQATAAIEAKESCYCCDKPFAKKTGAYWVWTCDGQRQFAGPECFRKIKKAGTEGYQPPKGGPRMFERNPNRG